MAAATADQSSSIELPVTFAVCTFVGFAGAQPVVVAVVLTHAELPLALRARTLNVYEVHFASFVKE